MQISSVPKTRADGDGGVCSGQRRAPAHGEKNDKKRAGNRTGRLIESLRDARAISRTYDVRSKAQSIVCG